MKKNILIFLLVLFGSLPIFGDGLNDTPTIIKLNLHRIKIETELTDLKTKFTESSPAVVEKNTELQVTRHVIEQLLLYKQTSLATFICGISQIILIFGSAV